MLNILNTKNLLILSASLTICYMFSIPVGEYMNSMESIMGQESLPEENLINSNEENLQSPTGEQSPNLSDSQIDNSGEAHLP